MLEKAGGRRREPPARPSGGSAAGRLPGFRRRFRLGSCGLRFGLRLAAGEDFDLAKTRHDELDGVAGVATLIFPGARTDLAEEAKTGSLLHGGFDQCDLGRREHRDAMPDPMRSGKQPTQTPYGC